MKNGRVPGVSATRRHGTVVLAVAAGVSMQVCVTAESFADARTEAVASRLRPEYDPLGLPLDLLFWEAGQLFDSSGSPPNGGESSIGSFIVYPSVEFSLEFTDNVFRAQDSQSDFIFRTTPLIRFNSDWDNHALNFEAGLEYGKYFSFSSEDYLDFLLGADGRIDVTDDIAFNANTRWVMGHEDRGDPDDPGSAFDITEYQRFSAGGSISYDAGIVQVEPGYEIVFWDYDNVNGPGGVLNNDDRDRTEHRAYLNVSTDVAEDLRLFVEPDARWEVYDNNPDDLGFNRDRQEIGVLVGLDWTPDDVWAVRGAVGYEYVEFDDPAFDATNGFIFTGDALWNIDELTTIALTAEREFDGTTLANSAGKVNTAVGLSVDHEFAYNIIGSAFTEYLREDFEGNNRADDTIRVGLGGDYYIGEYVVAGAQYTYTNRDSTDGAQSFSENNFLLSLLLRM